jgi:hypothetical protein
VDDLPSRASRQTSLRSRSRRHQSLPVARKRISPPSCVQPSPEQVQARSGRIATIPFAMGRHPPRRLRQNSHRRRHWTLPSPIGKPSDTSMHSLSPYAEFPPTTRASPYDANPRQLPPLEVPAASGIPIPIAESPSWTFDTLFSTAQDADAHRQSPRIESRGSEDERQLRLLGNGF